MYEAQQQRLRKFGRQGDLTEQQQQQLLASFLMRGVVSVTLCPSSSALVLGWVLEGIGCKRQCWCV